LVGDTIRRGARTYAVEDGEIHGYVDGDARDDQSARLRGWAVDPAGPKPADQILAFVDGHLVGRGEPTEDRPDIVEEFETSAVLKCGFELRAGVPAGDIDDVRVFALSGDGATELPRYGG
jgi:hypothetical protein